MVKVDAWMPIYWGDYAKDTGHLSALHHGAYLMLLKHYWTQATPLPADDAQLWRIACTDSLAQWRKIKGVVLAFFEERDGRLHHDRVERELAKAEGNAERRAEMARRAAEARWERERSAKSDAPRMPDAMPRECPPPSPSNSSHGKTITDAARAPASPDGPPRSRLPDSAKWAERLAGYRPWEGKRTWDPRWGLRPDSAGHNPLIPEAMLASWRADYAVALQQWDATSPTPTQRNAA